MLHRAMFVIVNVTIPALIVVGMATFHSLSSIAVCPDPEADGTAADAAVSDAAAVADGLGMEAAEAGGVDASGAAGAYVKPGAAGDEAHPTRDKAMPKARNASTGFDTTVSNIELLDVGAASTKAAPSRLRIVW
jgi:hypothetical protein